MTVVEKAYDPKQPRWPEGMPGIGGEWKPKGAPQAVLAGVQKAFEGIKVSDHPQARAVALLVRKQIHDIDWTHPGNQAIGSRLYQIGRVYAEGKSAAAVNNDKELYKRFDAALTEVGKVQEKSNVAGEGGVSANSPFPSVAERDLGHSLAAETQTKGIPKKVVGLPEHGRDKPKRGNTNELKRGPGVTEHTGTGAYIRGQTRPDPSTRALAQAVIRELEADKQKEADKLRFGESEKIDPPKTKELPLPMVGDISIMTEAENPLWGITASSLDRSDFFSARNKLASGRLFTDLTPAEANALEAVADQNALNLPPESNRAKMLFKVARELRLARGETGGPRPVKFPNISFQEKKGVPLIEMTRGELYRLATSYGISVKEKTKAEIVKEIEEKRDSQP